MKIAPRFLGLVMAMSIVFSAGAVAAPANDTETFESDIKALADQYGFKIESIEPQTPNARTSNSIVPVAEFDSMEEFEAALADGTLPVPSTTENFPMPVEAVDDTESSPGITTFATKYGTRNLK